MLGRSSKRPRPGPGLPPSRPVPGSDRPRGLSPRPQGTALGLRLRSMLEPGDWDPAAAAPASRLRLGAGLGPNVSGFAAASRHTTPTPAPRAASPSSTRWCLSIPPHPATVPMAPTRSSSETRSCDLLPAPTPRRVLHGSPGRWLPAWPANCRRIASSSLIASSTSPAAPAPAPAIGTRRPSRRGCGPRALWTT